MLTIAIVVLEFRDGGRSTAKSFKNVGIVRVSLGEKKERRQKGFVNELCPG